MPESALERVLRSVQGPSALDRVELSEAVVHRHTRREKTGKVENVRTYLRHTQGVGMGMGAKKGVFAEAESAATPSAPKSPKSQTPIKAVSGDAAERLAKRIGGKSGIIHKDVESVARRRLMEEGRHLDTSDRNLLFKQMGIDIKHPELQPHELYDRWNHATGKEKQDLRTEMDNIGKASAMYAAMMDHADKEDKINGVRNHAAWDNAVKKFGKAGNALLKVRDKLMTSKAVEAASKTKEAITEFGKEVQWRVAEGFLVSGLMGGVAAAVAHLGHSELLGEHVAHMLEGRWTEAAIGAAVSLTMAMGLKIARTHAKKLKAAKPRRADLSAEALELLPEGLIFT